MERENNQFERDLTPEERQIDAQLVDAMKVTPPAGLAGRIAAASKDALLEGQLDVALNVQVPEGLSQRVFDASVGSLHETPAVIGRVGHTVVWRKVALAACLVFAALVAIRFGIQTSQQQPFEPNLVAVVDVEVLSVEEEGLLLEDLDLTEFDYLSGTRELAFADVAESMNSLRNDLELWQYGLLVE